MIQPGHLLPDVTLLEYCEVERDGCSLGPNPVAMRAQAAGKTIALFGLPGAFTPTCSAHHLPGYIELRDTLHAAGVDEIWCVSVNDAFVMGAWGRSLGAGGAVRMLADGNGEFARASGLELDLRARGMGVRCRRFSMLVRNATVLTLNLEAPGRFEVSDARTLLDQVRQARA